MNCPQCQSAEKVKSGIVKEKQRYKCRGCSFHYTVEVKSTSKPKSMKKNALHLYLEGLGFRSIGRYLGVSNVSVLNWIKSFGEEVASLHQESKEIKVVELDEMHSYVGSKKTTVGSGLLLIDMGNGSSASLWAIGAEELPQNYGKQ